MPTIAVAVAKADLFGNGHVIVLVVFDLPRGTREVVPFLPLPHHIPHFPQATVPTRF